MQPLDFQLYLANMPSSVLLLFIAVVTSINEMPLIIKIKEQNGVRIDVDKRSVMRNRDRNPDMVNGYRPHYFQFLVCSFSSIRHAFCVR
jgi:hypothetical protein